MVDYERIEKFLGQADRNIERKTLSIRGLTNLSAQLEQILRDIQGEASTRAAEIRARIQLQLEAIEQQLNLKMQRGLDLGDSFGSF